jgi:hypothetical protein
MSADCARDMSRKTFRYPSCVNVSPDLQVNSFVQFDNESRGVGTNMRLRWTFAPAGDLFVVYNHIVRKIDPPDVA